MVIQDIQQLVRDGFTDWGSLGAVSVKEHHNMLLFNYGRTAEWNEFECLCRGLILERGTGRIIARPFDKFFNWNEGGRKGTGHIVTITEKVDGSLGILSRDPVDQQVKITTRGSFDSEQAVWATKFLHDNYRVEKLPVDTHTFMFEIIYPDNQIVVDYRGEEKLVLLGVRHNLTGNYLAWFPTIQQQNIEWGFELPKFWRFNSLRDIIEATGDLEFQELEGWVVEMSDGSRWKFKTDQYRELHRIVTSLTDKNLLKLIRQGEEYYQVIDNLPDKIKDEIEGRVATILEKHDAAYKKLSLLYDSSPKDTVSRKEFAAWVKDHDPQVAPYMFAFLDGKDISPMIFDKEF